MLGSTERKWMIQRQGEQSRWQDQDLDPRVVPVHLERSGLERKDQCTWHFPNYRALTHTGCCSHHKSNYSKIFTVVHSFTDWVLKLLLIMNSCMFHPNTHPLFSQVIVYCILALGTWDNDAARHRLLQFSVTDHILNTCTLNYSRKTWGGEGGTWPSHNRI